MANIPSEADRLHRAGRNKILRACLQKGQYATKYFNIFDLKSGD